MTHDEILAAFTAQIDSQLLGLGRFADAAHPEVAMLAKQVRAAIRAVVLTIVMGPEALTPPAAETPEAGVEEAAPEPVSPIEPAADLIPPTEPPPAP